MRRESGASDGRDTCSQLVERVAGSQSSRVPDGRAFAPGLAASLGLMRFLKSLLYGVGPLDYATIGGAVAVLLGCCAFAALWPARRAASIDPMRTLRAE